MDASARARAMQLLGEFNDELTRVFDDAFGTHWAEIEEMLVVTALITEKTPTTRRMAEITGLPRRAMSRLIARLQAEGLVITRPAEADRRTRQVLFTDFGQSRARALRASIIEFFRGSRALAGEIAGGLGVTVANRTAAADSADPLDLLGRVCQAGVALVRTMPDAATHAQLAARQRAALVAIATVGGMRPNDLSSALGVSLSGVTYIIDQLSRKGFVTRRRRVMPGDRRAVIVEVTPAGMAAVYSVMEGIEQQQDSLARLFAELAEWQPPSTAGDRPRSTATAGPTLEGQ